MTQGAEITRHQKHVLFKVATQNTILKNKTTITWRKNISKWKSPFSGKYSWLTRPPGSSWGLHAGKDEKAATWQVTAWTSRILHAQNKGRSWLNRLTSIQADVHQMKECSEYGPASCHAPAKQRRKGRSGSWQSNMAKAKQTHDKSCTKSQDNSFLPSTVCEIKAKWLDGLVEWRYNLKVEGFQLAPLKCEVMDFILCLTCSWRKW